MMSGGYSENNLTAYTDLAACVTADTNGLKAVSCTDGIWSFGARQTGSGSGILGKSQKQASSGITVNVVSESKFGDFIRVDLKGDYGDMGSNMQTVEWKYYGTASPDSPDAEPLAVYGTKFAADNWMHKSNGIQLGLTESLRCRLPENTDGTGYWTVTVYALGYEDYCVTVNVTNNDLHGGNSPITDEQKTELTSLKEQAESLLAGYDEATAGDTLKALKEHYDEAVTLLAMKRRHRRRRQSS